MKELDDLIKKIGNDKVSHFLGGGLICSLISIAAILQEHNLSPMQQVSLVLIGTSVVAFLSVVKEIIMDDKPDWLDLLASILGCIPVFLSVGIGIWFNVLSETM